MTKWSKLLWKNSRRLTPCQRRNLTLIPIRQAQWRNQSSGVQYHSGLHLFLNSAKRFWWDWVPNSFSEWGKVRLCNTFSVTVVTGYPRQRLGVLIPISMLKIKHQSWLKKPIEHVAKSWRNTAQLFGGNVMPKIFQKVLHIRSPNGEFTKETDIMDVVGLDSGSWNGVVVNRPELT